MLGLQRALYWYVMSSPARLHEVTPFNSTTLIGEQLYEDTDCTMRSRELMIQALDGAAFTRQ